MADKNIRELPEAEELEDESLLAVAQQGTAMKLTGKKLRSFAEGALERFIQGAGYLLSIGKVTTGAAGSEAKVTNSGTAQQPVLDFIIPQGEKGDKGDPGGVESVNGQTGDVTVTKDQVGLGLVPNVGTSDQTPAFVQASKRENIASGEKLSVLFGKIMKWFADLKNVAFTGNYADLTGVPTTLKNPRALSFTGGGSGSYDGSAAKTVTIPFVQTGTGTVGNTAGYENWIDWPVTFPTAYSSTPLVTVFLTTATGHPYWISITSVSKTGFDVRIDMSGNSSYTFRWMAIGL